MSTTSPRSDQREMPRTGSVPLSKVRRPTGDCRSGAKPRTAISYSLGIALMILAGFLCGCQRAAPTPIDMAEDQMAAEKFAEAAATLDQFLAQHPHDATAWKLIGQCRMALAEYDGAVEAYSQGLEFEVSTKKKADLYLCRSLAYEKLNQEDAAAADLQMSRKLDGRVVPPLENPALSGLEPPTEPTENDRAREDRPAVAGGGETARPTERPSVLLPETGPGSTASPLSPGPPLAAPREPQAAIHDRSSPTPSRSEGATPGLPSALNDGWKSAGPMREGVQSPAQSIRQDGSALLTSPSAPQAKGGAGEGAAGKGTGSGKGAAATRGNVRRREAAESSQRARNFVERKAGARDSQSGARVAADGSEPGSGNEGPDGQPADEGSDSEKGPAGRNARPTRRPYPPGNIAAPGETNDSPEGNRTIWGFPLVDQPNAAPTGYVPPIAGQVPYSPFDTRLGRFGGGDGLGVGGPGSGFGGELAGSGPLPNLVTRPGAQGAAAENAYVKPPMRIPIPAHLIDRNYGLDNRGDDGTGYYTPRYDYGREDWKNQPLSRPQQFRQDPNR